MISDSQFYNNEAGPIFDPYYRDYRYRTASLLYLKGGTNVLLRRNSFQAFIGSFAF